MPTIRLPDGSTKSFPAPLTVAELAQSIGAGLARAALAGRVNGKLVDTSYRIDADAEVSIVTERDPEGVEILRHIKAASPETVVIMMTAYGSTQAAVGALKLGAQDYLIKPFDIEELRIVVRNCLDRQRLEQENVLLRAELGTQVEEGDEVRVGGKLIGPRKQQHVYIALNKPVGIVCTTVPLMT